MIDYNKLLIDLLNEKIRRLEQSADAKRKEISRLQRENRELRKELENLQNSENLNEKGGEIDGVKK